MKIVMDQQQYQELETLIDIFDGMFFDGEDVQCFRFLKNLVDNQLDVADVKKEEKERMKKQLKEALDWLASLNVRIKCKDEFISCF